MSLKPLFRISLAAAVALSGLAAQQPPAASATTTVVPISQIVPASYVAGPGDVLAMSVYGAPELADNGMRIDQNGTILTPYGSTPVKVAGMTTVQIQAAIAAELVKDQLAVNPKVEVRVVDPESHPIVISGQGIRQAITLQAVRPISLLDAINQAGGLSSATGNITVVSHSANGAVEQTSISAQQLLTSTGSQFNPLLHGGEIVRVLPGGNAYLSGAVSTPGVYALSDTDPLTIRKAMAKAHGLAKFAKADQTQLIHHLGEPDQSTTIINLSDILNGRRPDIRLHADDMVYVPVSGGKQAASTAWGTTLSVLTMAAGGWLLR